MLGTAERVCVLCEVPGAHFKQKALHRIRRHVNGQPVAEVWETLNYRLCTLCQYLCQNDTWVYDEVTGECRPVKAQADSAASRARIRQLGIGEG